MIGFIFKSYNSLALHIAKQDCYPSVLSVGYSVEKAELLFLDETGLHISKMTFKYDSPEELLPITDQKWHSVVLGWKNTGELLMYFDAVGQIIGSIHWPGVPEQ